jgi:SAM-dependent methyltransferase
MPRPWTFAFWSHLNRARFAWRRWRFRPRRGLALPVEPWDDLFPAASELAREAERLRQRYGLDWPDEHANQRENLHVVGMLEAALKPVASHWPASLDVLDIGAKDWHYLPGAYRLLSRVGTTQPRAVTMTGIELDPYTRYQDGYTRQDYANRYAQGLEAEYRVGDVRAHQGAYDVILLLHPFWREREVLDWGLPGECFDIDGLLKHAWSLLKPGGVLLVTAYRSEEPWAEAAIARQGWSPVVDGIWRSPFVRAAASLYWVFRA